MRCTLTECSSQSIIMQVTVSYKKNITLQFVHLVPIRNVFPDDQTRFVLKYCCVQVLQFAAGLCPSIVYSTPVFHGVENSEYFNFQLLINTQLYVFYFIVYMYICYYNKGAYSAHYVLIIIIICLQCCSYMRYQTSFASINQTAKLFHLEQFAIYSK